MAAYSQRLGPHTYRFRDLSDLLAQASPERSGDQLAGVAACSEEARVAARWALAVQHQGPWLLRLTADRLLGLGWHLAPVVVATRGRVALGDEIGALLDARQVSVFLGERPGLSAPDSLGVYFTHAPRVGRTDAERNCLSNVRPEGMSCEAAAEVLVHLMGEARRRGFTGIGLQDDRGLPATLPAR